MSLPIEMQQEIYVPSAVERKKALVMYMFFGILLTLSKKEPLSIYEAFHLKQAIGRWIVFFLILVSGSLFLFLPFLKILPILAILGGVVIRGLCIKQARDGKYLSDPTHDKKGVLYAIGLRIRGLFELEDIIIKKDN